MPPPLDDEQAPVPNHDPSPPSLAIPLLSASASASADSDHRTHRDHRAEPQTSPENAAQDAPAREDTEEEVAQKVAQQVADEASDRTVEASPAGDTGVDELVTRTAQRIATVINHFKRELDLRDGVWGTANGSFELALNTDGSHVYELTIVHDPDGEEYPVTVRARRKEDKNPASAPAPTQNADGPNGHVQPAPSLTPLVTTLSPTASKRTRRGSDAALENDFVSRKKRRLDVHNAHAVEDDGQSSPRKRARLDGQSDQDVMPLVSRYDLENLLSKLRDDIQDDTTECVNHMQRLLRRFRDEWRERTASEDEHGVARSGRDVSRDSLSANAVAFPSAVASSNDDDASVADVVRRESRLLSSQIRWVEECRRVASSVQHKREENWRTTAATFHDKNRMDREAFQHRMIHESGIQGAMLNQILNEVKTISLYQQAQKWETPEHLAHSYPPQPMAPAFPTQAPHPPARGGAARGGVSRGGAPRGRGRGTPNKQ